MRTYIRNLTSALSNIRQQGCHEMKDCYGNERIDSRCFFIIILFSYYQNSHSKKNSKSKKAKTWPVFKYLWHGCLFGFYKYGSLRGPTLYLFWNHNNSYVRCIKKFLILKSQYPLYLCAFQITRQLWNKRRPSVWYGLRNWTRKIWMGIIHFEKVTFITPRYVHVRVPVDTRRRFNVDTTSYIWVDLCSCENHHCGP